MDNATSDGSESRVAIVTGAAQGMGREHVLGFARRGFRTVVADINLAAAEETAALAREEGGEAIAVAVDVSDRDATLSLAETVDKAFGRADILVNNAAIYHSMRLDPVLEVDIEYWRRMFAVNLDGALLCIQAVAPLMIPRGWGRIINISSIAAYNGGAGPYGASKVAILHLTRAAAMELGRHGITVNAVLPGPIDTEATAVTVGLDLMQQSQAKAPITRLGTVEDIASAVRFLASDDAAWITAQAIQVDGGSFPRY